MRKLNSRCLEMAVEILADMDDDNSGADDDNDDADDHEDDYEDEDEYEDEAEEGGKDEEDVENDNGVEFSEVDDDHDEPSTICLSSVVKRCSPRSWTPFPCSASQIPGSAPSCYSTMALR